MITVLLGYLDFNFECIKMFQNDFCKQQYIIFNATISGQDRIYPKTHLCRTFLLSIFPTFLTSRFSLLSTHLMHLPIKDMLNWLTFGRESEMKNINSTWKWRLDHAYITPGMQRTTAWGQIYKPYVTIGICCTVFYIMLTDLCYFNCSSRWDIFYSIGKML